ncbi:MAG TPA: sigma-70 family RNA polymerase sigma factor [Gaiellaceae bacterium]|nr:sigma-70 family RNA polymerase sigma factor [Gaiellaceae bacterium]
MQSERLPVEPNDGEQLLAELRPLVVRTVRLVVGAGSAIAEDAAQDALVELDRALPSLRNPAAARAFAARIATRVAVRTATRERRFALLGLRANAAERLTTVQPPDLVELKEAFDALPPRQRATAVLRLYVGLSEQETADALGCAVGTVKRQLHDARAALAAHLQEGHDD